MRIANSTSQTPTLPTHVCCKGYVFRENPKCNEKCTAICMSGYCPANKQTADCHCYDNYNVTVQSQCQPVCKNVANSTTVSCVNGQCDAQGNCNCLAKHSKDPSQGDMCVPNDCLDYCVDGTCNSHGCVPSTARVETCTNVTCTDNDECKCEKDNSDQLTTTKGHEEESSTFASDDIDCPSLPGAAEHQKELCLEKCHRFGCYNGVCSELGDCTCNSGYVKGGSGECVEITCPTEEANEFCQRYCSTNCKEGTCDDKGSCSCDAGYQKIDERSFACSPTCKVACHADEECSSPDMCTCKEGYVKSRENCVAKCTELSCTNGQCQSDGFCKCLSGYDLDANNGCSASCAQKCLHGFCRAPNECGCDDGYEKDETKICVPVCREGCENGKCVAPDECDCNEGYPAYKGECREECHQDGSCWWKQVLSDVGKGVVFGVCAAIIVVILLKLMKKCVALLVTSADVDIAMPLENVSSEQPEKLQDECPEEKRADSQVTKGTCLSYSRMEEGGVADSGNLDNEVKRSKKPASVFYSLLKKDSLADVSDGGEQEGEKETVDKGKLGEIPGPAGGEKGDEVNDNDGVEQEGEKEIVDKGILEEIPGPAGGEKGDEVNDNDGGEQEGEKEIVDKGILEEIPGPAGGEKGDEDIDNDGGEQEGEKEIVDKGKLGEISGPAGGEKGDEVNEKDDVFNADQEGFQKVEKEDVPLV